MPQFDDKTVLVTGGNDGIGRAIALAFAKEGANVVIAARRVKEGEEVVTQIRGEGGTALFVETDISIAAQAQALVSTCVSAFGGLHYAVNNAGIEGTPFVPTADYDEDVWDRVLRVNLTGTVCVNSFETTWLRKLGSTHNVDGEAVLQSERSPWTTHEFIAFRNSVAGMVRVRAGQITLP